MAIASLTVKNLSKWFGTTAVLKDISFEVADGEFCILLGPSGCGKTTILRLIAGLEPPSSGTVVVGGERIDPLPPRDRDIAFVFQNYALYPHMTVFDNLAFSLRLRGAAAAEMENKVRDAAVLLEIDEFLQRKPHGLSGGQRQRVALGRAIVRQPKIFLFDEPLSNLDAALRASMRIELARLHRRLGATILYVTHDQAEALTLGEKIVVLDQGTIQQIGSPSDIYERPANRMVAGFVGSPAMNFLEGRLEAAGSLFQCGHLSIDLAKALGRSLSRHAGRALTLGIRAEDFRPADDFNEAWLRGEVEIVEDLGSDRFVHLACEGIELVARVGRDLPLRSGQTLGLKADPLRLHFFHQNERISF